MYNFTESGTIKYWDDYKDQSLAKMMKYIQSIQVNPAKLSAKDSENLNIILDAFTSEEKMLEYLEDLVLILSRIDFATSLYFLNVLEERNPGYAGSLLEFVEDFQEANTDENFTLFFEQNNLFEKLRFFKNTFKLKHLKWIQENV